MATDLTNLNGHIYLNAKVTATGDTNLSESTVADAIDWSQNDTIEFGATYDQMWHDQRTVAGLTADDIDLQGESNSFGDTITLTSVTHIIIKNVTTDAAIATYFRCTTDNPQATWVATDDVRNKTGAGDDWTGTIHYKIDNSNYVIELAT